MAKRRWTVVLVPHGAEPSRIIEVSYSALRGVAGAVLIAVLVALLLGFTTLSHSVDLSRAARLSQENARLAEQLDEMHSRLAILDDTLALISKRDQRIRILANLEPIDPQVRAAGIGGPGTTMLPADGPERRGAEMRVDLGGLIRRANLLASSFREAVDSLSMHSERLAATPSIMPTQGWLSSAFSSKRLHPVLHMARRHEGIDVSAPMGSPIEAPGNAVVREAGWRTGYGYTVELDHGFGIRTLFAHTSKVLVRPGQRVKRGERIALVGNSGLATGPHLHYEVHVNGRPVDPLKYVLPDAITD